MTTNEREIATTPDRVWSVLADGWTYPLWVVGASRVRAVDPAWPAVGSLIHHSVGAWPDLLDDDTEVLDVDDGRAITLEARAWPAGSAHVTLELQAAGAHTRVTIHEQPVSGPGALVPAPLTAPALKWRNTETLRRLAYVAERRGRP